MFSSSRKCVRKTKEQMYIDHLSSAQNLKIKNIIALKEKSSFRRESGLFVAEGVREIEAALEGGFEIESLYFVPDLISEEKIQQFKSEKYFTLSADIYLKVAYRGTTEGVIALIKHKERRLHDIKLSKNPLIIVLESVEKPGNLGAVLRTADAARADAVIICDPLTDIFNPNVIRASIGGVFTNNIIACSSAEALEWLESNKIKILTAELQASVRYDLVDMKGAIAIVMGAESEGLSSFWRDRANERIIIPMGGFRDSLNVSVSTAIICFEALRQRDFK